MDNMNLKTARISIFVSLSLFAITCKSTAAPGAWDKTYAPVVSGGPVYAMALQTDSKLLVGGAFTSVNASSARNHLARLFSDGSLDSTFFNTGSGVSSTIWSLAVQTDGRIVIGGDFTSINGTTRTRVARLNSNGTVDGSFVPTNTIYTSVLALAVQSDNKVIVGGSFSSSGFPSWNARLNADGTTDTAFSSYPNGAVNAIAIQSDGKIVIGGAFTTVNGATRNRIARLNSDGSLDNTFQNGLTGASGTVRCLQIQNDNKILLGGDFTSVNGITRSYIARLTSSGSLDNGFAASAGANGPVYSIAVQPDNCVVIGGSFSGYAPTYNLSRVARLYPDGTCDSTFTNFGINNIVQALVVQSDGGLLIGGTFTTINNTNWPSLSRLYGNLYPPEFAIQPISRSTNVGANVTFSAQVYNPTSSNFQWRKDGNNILGATGTAYSLYNLQFSDAGNYSVFVSNAAGGTTSSNALLQVGTAPTFVSQATSLSVTQGQSASFNVIASGTPLNYFWKKNGIFIPGATNNSLNFANVVATNTATYTCQVSNFLGSITSTGAVLAIAYPPTISIQPVGQTIGVGSNFTLSVTASGTPAVAYQWRTNGMAITGATTSIYTVTAAQTNNSADYDVVITNSMGSITSSIATVSVINYSPSIYEQPVGVNVLVGNSISLSAYANGTSPLNWQWRTNGTPIFGANDSSYVINRAQLTDAGSYDVVVMNMAGSITSSVAVVNVGYAPVIVQQPLSLTNSVSGTANFSCFVTGTAPINLQWTFNGYPISRATNATLTITNLQPSNIGYYALTATNLFGGTVSSNAMLNLLDYDFGIWNGLAAYYPFNGNAKDATTNHLDFSGTALFASDRFGTDQSAIIFTNTFPITTTSISLTPSGMSVAFWLNLIKTPSVTGERVLMHGSWNAQTGLFSFAVWADGHCAISFRDATGNPKDVISSAGMLNLNQWYHIAFIENGSNLTLIINGIQIGAIAMQLPADTAPLVIGGESQNCFVSGLIDELRVYNRALTSSEVASLYALQADLPVIKQQPQTQSVNVGGDATFSLIATASHSLSYQWFKDGVALMNKTNASLTLSNVQPNQIGYYTVTVSNAVAGVSSSNAALSLIGYNFSQWQGLVANYPFNGNANDESGNGNNGTNNGAVLTSDRFGFAASAYLFNGSNSFVDCGTNIYLGAPYSQFTVSTWIKASGAGSIVTDYDAPSGGDDTFAASISIHGASQIETDTRVTGHDYDAFSTRSALTNQWHQAVYIMDGASNLLLYVDGQLDHTTAYIAASNYYSNPHWRIGANVFLGSLNDYFDGSIDDVRIYNRALSSNDVALLYALEADVPVITQQPQSQTVNTNSTVSFSVGVTALHPLSYQWLKNGAPIAGATNTFLTLTNVQSGDVGFYSITVSNNITGVISSSALLNLTGFADPTWKGLVAYYPFNGNANDESGNGNNSAICNTALGKDRFNIENQSYDFFGTNYIKVANSQVLPSGAAERTISCWAKSRDGLKHNNADHIVNWGTTLIGHSFGLIVYTGNHWWGYGNSLDLDSGIQVGTNWTHVVVTYQSGMKLYINGQLCAYSTNTLNTVGKDLFFGERPDMNADSYFFGSADDIRIYNRALSSDEVAYLYSLESQATLLPPQMLSANLNTPSNLSLNLIGMPNESYVLQAATNLTSPIQWQSLLTNTADTNGTCQFTDTNLNSAQKFYRVTTP